MLLPCLLLLHGQIAQFLQCISMTLFPLGVPCPALFQLPSQLLHLLQKRLLFAFPGGQFILMLACHLFDKRKHIALLKAAKLGGAKIASLLIQDVNTPTSQGFLYAIIS